MTSAIKSAGFAVPANKRVWLWLKDHPGKTAGEIRRALGTGGNTNIPGILNDMGSRGMVSVSLIPRAKNVRMGRLMVNSYVALGAEFELLPRRKKGAPVVIAKHTASTPPPAPEAEKPVAKFAINIENTTLHDARALYTQLAEFFG
jgi:hypothetical protein